MKKRLFAALLTVVMCVGMSAPALAVPAEYIDVPSGHWAEEGIYRATEQGLFTGVSESRFGFGQEINRASFVTALVRLFGWKLVNPAKGTFADVQSGAWYYSYVETAVKYGAVAVIGDTFRPDASMTRGEMIAMLMRAMGFAGLAGTAGTYPCPFTDVTTNKSYITLAADLGIAGGVGGGRFAPGDTAKREEAAAFLARVYDKMYVSCREIDDAEGRVKIVVDTPAAVPGAAMPTTPLEPIDELYAKLRQMKGQDMSRAVLSLTAGGVRTVVSADGTILQSDRITEREVQDALAQRGVRTYYSRRYECAYCIYQPNEYQTVTIWYQDAESIGAKMRLARLFGVTEYILE